MTTRHSTRAPLPRNRSSSLPSSTKPVWVSAQASAHQDPASGAGVQPAARGLLRLRACRPRDGDVELQQRRERLGDRITEAAEEHPPHVQLLVQEGLERMGWMVDQGVPGLGPSKGIEQLERLEQLLLTGQPPMHELDAWARTMSGFVHDILKSKSDLANEAPDDEHAFGWNLTFARLLVGPNDRCERTVLPIVRELLASAGADWLPLRHRGDRIAQLRQLVDRPALLEGVDQLAGTDPLHAQAEHHLSLGGVITDQSLRKKLVLEIVITLLSPPLQDQVGNCWLQAQNRNIHFNHTEDLLTWWGGFLRDGTMGFANAAGGTDQVVPHPYSEQAMRWAMQSRAQWAGPDSFCAKDLEKLTDALKRAFPQVNRSRAEWKAAIKIGFDKLQAASRGPVKTLDVIEQVVAADIGLPAAALSKGHDILREERPELAATRVLLSQHAALVEDVLFAVETANFSPLAHVWQSTYSAHVMQEKLDRCWEPIEAALRESAKKLMPVAGMNEHLTRMRQVFMQSANLRTDPSAEFGDARFRLMLKVPGAQGRGMAIRKSEELLAWLGHYSQCAGQPGQPGLHANSAACVARVGKVLRKTSFKQRLEGRSGTAAAKPLWFNTAGTVLTRGDFKAIAQADRAHRDGRIDPVLVHRSTTYYVDGKNYALGFQDMAGRFGRKRSAETCLIGLIEQTRVLKKSQLFDFQAHLAENRSIVFSTSVVEDPLEGHVFTHLPYHPTYRTAWESEQLTAKQWIAKTLKKPMKRALQQQLEPQQARDWVQSVLSSCVLKKNQEEGVVEAAMAAAVDEVMRTARGVSHASPTDKLSLQSLCTALHRFSTSPSDALFDDPKTRREQLTVAVLNALPGGAPHVVVAHSNWKRAPHLAQVASPFTGKITPVEGMEIPQGLGQSQFRFKGLAPRFAF